MTCGWVLLQRGFLTLRRVAPAYYFPLRHANTLTKNSCVRRNFRRNIHGFQSEGKQYNFLTNNNRCPVFGNPPPQGPPDILYVCMAPKWFEIMEHTCKVFTRS